MKLLLIACAALAGASAVSIAQIDAACARLLDWYDWPSGLFTSDGADSFWTTANAFETLANYQLLTGNASCGGNATFEGYLSHSLKQLNGAITTDAFRDDHLWWTLAFARMHEATGSATFLDTAEEIYGLLVGPWHAWNTTCGGAWRAPVQTPPPALRGSLLLAATACAHDMGARPCRHQLGQRRPLRQLHHQRTVPVRQHEAAPADRRPHARHQFHVPGETPASAP